MRNIDEVTITQAVLDAMEGCENPRLLEVMTGLVRHLHAFARETRLTEDEWRQQWTGRRHAGRAGTRPLQALADHLDAGFANLNSCMIGRH